MGWFCLLLEFQRWSVCYQRGYPVYFLILFPESNGCREPGYMHHAPCTILLQSSSSSSSSSSSQYSPHPHLYIIYLFPPKHAIVLQLSFTWWRFFLWCQTKLIEKHDRFKLFWSQSAWVVFIPTKASMFPLNPLHICPSLSSVRGCSHIMSAKIGGVQTLPSPLLAKNQKLAWTPSSDERIS